ncbi:hypothetical protein C3387_22010 [Leclercia sp. LSNIH6]|uniref:Uncharacterized protein n=1 Tax=Leclercia adecarboxylata TaxID=83655 RepID=A0AAP9AFC9_9ENTR|nr:hypothetical protein C3370_22355 [Leclercia sp. LSNIH7]POU73088.1 hypothetical protein C3387_22010 [Leclercia sp. LSNIH6]POW49018.1 hypothetical protein C3406_22290 [Leclercia sp. LSNIH8]PSS47314.1 hypothetical protein C6560_17360 [Enterobacter sp. FS01]QDK16835.1 hypothetical protein ES815_00215 [Leclercia adecarboxylata]
MLRLIILNLSKFISWMILLNMTNIKLSMILCSCFNYHIVGRFPAALIRFLVKPENYSPDT